MIGNKIGIKLRQYVIMEDALSSGKQLKAALEETIISL